LEAPNPEYLLKPGMFVRVQVEFARREDATLVPLTALVRRNGKEGVFIVDIGNLKARFVPVTTGIINGELAEITEPQISGLVVTMGNHLLEDGSDIVLPKRDARSPISPGTGVDLNTAPVNAGPGESR
jgi:multidrug efflux pump subunit AcrA (membrane-fusion protein)